MNVLGQGAVGNPKALAHLEQPRARDLARDVALQGACQARQQARPHGGVIAGHRVLDQDGIGAWLEKVRDLAVDETVSDDLRVAETDQKVRNARARSLGERWPAERQVACRHAARNRVVAVNAEHLLDQVLLAFDVEPMAGRGHRPGQVVAAAGSLRRKF